LASWAARARLWGSPLGLSIVVGVIVLANILYIFGITQQDAIWWTSGIAHATCWTACSHPAIDPNVGFLTQALGHLAATDLLHGHLPWWNPFEGIGMPLAGEMQSGALSPLVLLFALPNGLVWFHLALQLIAGVSTYLLCRRFVTSELIACVVGVLFGLNGTLAWLGNSVENPVAFLPLAMLGVELIIRSAGKRQWRWGLLAIAVALSLYAGFPEVAYFDTLFVGIYAFFRLSALPRIDRKHGIVQLAAGFIGGLVLALPILVAFEDFLKVALVGIHADTSGVALPHQIWPMFVDPYVYGPIQGDVALDRVWGSVGGYFTIGVVTLALYALGGPTYRRIRLFLGGWTVLSLLGAFNFFHVLDYWDMIPQVNKIVLGRYIIATCEMAFIMLAMFGLDDLLAKRRPQRSWQFAAGASFLLLLVAELYGATYTRGVVWQNHMHMMVVVGRALPLIALAVMWGAPVLLRRPVAIAVIALALITDAGFAFGLPEVLAPTSITVAQGPLNFLETHLQGSRFISFGPISPNWASYFAISDLNAHDLPFSAKFQTLINSDIPIGRANPTGMYMVWQGTADAVAFGAALAAHMPQFENAGVKYAIAFTKWPMSPALATAGLRSVYQDGTYTIYQFPFTTGLYTAAGCTISASSLNAVTVTCPSTSILIRRELSMPGWTAAVNGNGVGLDLQAPYQALAVPAGTSHVTFNFTPPHELLAEVGFFVGLGALAATRRRNRLQRLGLPHAIRDVGRFDWFRAQWHRVNAVRNTRKSRPAR